MSVTLDQIQLLSLSKRLLQIITSVKILQPLQRGTTHWGVGKVIILRQ